MTTGNLFSCTLASLALAGALTWGTGHVAAQSAGRTGQGTPKYRVLFNRFQSPTMTVFIADADGKNERALFPPGGLEYSPRYSPDGQWVVYTSEQNGLADIYRMHPDGTGVGRSGGAVAQRADAGVRLHARCGNGGYLADGHRVEDVHQSDQTSLRQFPPGLVA